MSKELRKWNGRAHGKKYTRGHFYIAAYSMAQAGRLMGQAAEMPSRDSFTREIRDYYSECWGDPMKGIEPTEPCVYATLHLNDKPIRIL